MLALLAVLPAQAQADPDSTLQTRPIDEPEERGGALTADDEARRYDLLVARFQRPYLRFTALIQVVPSAVFGSRGGLEDFEIAAARFGIAGRLDGGIGYQLRADFVREPALLDAFVSYGTRDVRGIVGLQRAPFSYEQLTSAASIDFVNRSRAVRAIAPPREVGLEIRLQPRGGPLVLRLGTFNAAYDAGFDEADRNGYLVAGRAQLTLGDAANRQLILGANAGYETTGRAAVPNPSLETSARVCDHDDPTVALYLPARLIAGADARFRYGRLLLAAEGLLQEADEVRRGLFAGQYARPDLYGGYATAGIDLTRRDRALVRLDHLEGQGTEVLLGYNRQITRAASFQANAVLPATDDAGSQGRVLFNVQLGF